MVRRKGEDTTSLLLAPGTHLDVHRDQDTRPKSASNPAELHGSIPRSDIIHAIPCTCSPSRSIGLLVIARLQLMAHARQVSNLGPGPRTPRGKPRVGSILSNPKTMTMMITPNRILSQTGDTLPPASNWMQIRNAHLLARVYPSCSLFRHRD